MATIQLLSAFSFLKAQDWSFAVTTNSTTKLVLSNASLGNEQSFNGSFSYDQFGSVFGTVTSTSFIERGVARYTVTGMDHDAGALQNFAETTGDTQAMYAFVLSGADLLRGSNGTDTILGYGGNDSINGRAGADTMLGGAGSDTYHVDDVNDRAVERTALNSEVDAGGIDRVYSSVSFTLGQYVENLVLAGSAAVNGTGNGAANSLTGNNAANVLTGQYGKDRLVGAGGADVLLGGMDADRLQGGGGADVFRYTSYAESVNSEGKYDTITDFTLGVDTIDLSQMDAVAATAGVNDAFAFVGSGAFTGAGQVRIEINMTSNIVILYGNLDADSHAEFSIRLTGVDSLAATDIIL